MLVIAILVVLWALAARADAGPADEPHEVRARTARIAGTARTAEIEHTGGPDGIDRIDIDDDEDLPETYGRRARGRARVAPATVERTLALAPPIDRVLDAAYRAAGLGDDPTPGWRTRSRLSWIVPVISVRAGQNQSWREVSDPTISRGIGLDMRMSWHFERLLFDPNETRIAMLDVSRRREKRRIAEHTIEVFFAWIGARAAADHAAASRAAVERAGASADRTAAQVDREVRAILEAAAKAAELDALTAGWFSQALANSPE